MKDMTRGPVSGHVLQLASFIALTTTFQTPVLLQIALNLWLLRREFERKLQFAGPSALPSMAGAS